MSGRIEARLSEMGVTLPAAPAPAANYRPYILDGGLVHVSGQLPFENGAPVAGRLGESMDIAAGRRAARLCALALLAQVREAAGGDLDRLGQVLRITGFVNSAAAFTDQPQVINGASDFLAEALGEAGAHARAAVGVAALPFGAAVEIDGLFRLS